MYRFTTHPHSRNLQKEDFQLFASLFKECINKKIPGSSKILFISELSQLKREYADLVIASSLRKNLDKAFHGGKGIYKGEQDLIIPFSVEGGQVAALFQSVDSFFLKQADHGWLEGVKNELLSEFTLIKQANIDSKTGLPNLDHLFHVLHSYEQSENLYIMLMEIASKGRGINKYLHHNRVTVSLKSFFNDKVLIHYIGQGVFVIVTNNHDQVSLSRLGSSLISWFRSEKFKRIHIGCSNKSNTQTSINSNWNRELLDQAWHALQIAGKRGPCSYCDYSLLIHPENHPLCKLSRRIITKFQRKWRSADVFTVVQFKIANGVGIPFFLEKIQDVKKDLFVIEGSDLYLYLEEMEAQEAKDWISDKIYAFKEQSKIDISISMGIASYPYLNFKKTETLLNCKKALLHGDFFGPGSIVVFDSVSLNISGDIYYGDGDFPNAIKEYRRGLLGDKENINLLNSLGVAYAAVQKQKDAQECFKKVLRLDQENFMALYNLGIGEELQGENELALCRLEKAVALPDKGDEAKLIENELLFQIGKLCCITGKYKKCIDILLPWYSKKKDEAGSKRALRYLGKAFYFGLNDFKKAMKYLQRAMQFDEFDAESLGLLGVVYLDGGEGIDISLRLCEKSVELDAQNKQLRLQLAKSQIACGLLAEAKNNLRKCISTESTQTESCYYLGWIYEKEGKYKRARSWYEKISNSKIKSIEMKKHLREFIRVHA